MKRYILILFLAILLFPACTKKITQTLDPGPATKEISGTIKSFSPLAYPFYIDIDLGWYDLSVFLKDKTGARFAIPSGAVDKSLNSSQNLYYKAFDNRIEFYNCQGYDYYVVLYY